MTRLSRAALLPVAILSITSVASCSTDDSPPFSGAGGDASTAPDSEADRDGANAPSQGGDGRTSEPDAASDLGRLDGTIRDTAAGDAATEDDGDADAGPSCPGWTPPASPGNCSQNNTNEQCSSSCNGTSFWQADCTAGKCDCKINGQTVCQCAMSGDAGCRSCCPGVP